MSNFSKPRCKTHVYHKIYCEAYGLSCIQTGYCIHHRDGDSWNNDIDNLQLMTQAEHNKLHHTGNKYSIGRKLSDETKQKMSLSHIGIHKCEKNGNYRKATIEMLEDIKNCIRTYTFVKKYKCSQRVFYRIKKNLKFYELKLSGVIQA